MPRNYQNFWITLDKKKYSSPTLNIATILEDILFITGFQPSKLKPALLFSIKLNRFDNKTIKTVVLSTI